MQHRLLICLFAIWLLALTSQVKAEHEPLPHGIAAGDVSSTSAVLWSRAPDSGSMHFLLHDGYGRPIHRRVEVSAAQDYTAKVTFKRLQANTLYHYKVWFGGSTPAYAKYLSKGEFSTAPKAPVSTSVKLSWSGDFAGQNVCRDASEGFPIMQAIAAEENDLFIGLGDMIYADNTCEETGRYGNAQVPGDFIQSADLKNFWAHWRYSREDEGLKSVLASTPYYAVWDDHEVVNDFGPLHDTRDTEPYTAGENLIPDGLQAYLDYNPIMPKARTPKRLYRKFRWGKHLELYFLDNRQYRDANLSPDATDRSKTMLGREQLVWLQEGLAESDATWKVIVSSVPISIPTGFPLDLGRDGWANFDQGTDPTVDGIPQSDTGFENELVQILQPMQQRGDKVLFITTDVHFAEVFRYTPFPDSDFQFHEVVIGPGNAGLFPNRDFDTTLGSESLFFFGPESFDAVTDWEEAKTWFNYGTLEIDSNGVLTTKVKNTIGETVYELTLQP